MISLNTELTYIKGVGPKRAEILYKEIGVKTVEDIIYYFPYKYIDRSRFYKIIEIKSDAVYVQIRGKFCCFSTEGQGAKKYLHGEFFDETGSIDVVWFKRIDWVKKKISPLKEYILFGKPKIFKNRFSISHPEFESVESFKKKIKAPFTAEYNTTEKMKKFFLNSKAILKIIQEIFKNKISLTEILPQNIIKKYQFPEINEAIFNIHFPQSQSKLQAAKQRFKFEELFINQLGLLKQKLVRTQQTKGILFNKVGDYFNTFYNNNLEFELTNAQKKVIKEIYADFKSGKQCNRLLQGDVGSGKTVVALMSMLIAIDNGYQTTLMAPTEILAQQHFESISKMLKNLDINVKLLTGSTKTKQRRIINEQLSDGSLNILIGTHALIEDTVQFKKLGLVIIDEQHRFGVIQRGKLAQKTKDLPPHIIIMSATPIPRTLSMTLYGDLDVSIIDEMPLGRKPVKTYHIYPKQKAKLYKFIQDEINKGRQVYIVYPLISESEKMDYKDLEQGYESITKIFKPPKYNVAMVHGKLKPDEKKAQMDKFVNGQANILVATTVIEVGVDVPNATIMIIESAERFGLSQLHQLRGRVGRGAEQSYCFLVSGNKISADARKRLETMVRTNNGFEIAEVDMKLRGAGDIFGTQQSGSPINFKIANLMTDFKILEWARQEAEKILDNDPELQKPENKPIAHKIKNQISFKLGNIG